MKNVGLGCFGLTVALIIVGAFVGYGKKDSNTQVVGDASSSAAVSNTNSQVTTPTAPRAEQMTISNSAAKKAQFGLWEVVGEIKNNDSIKHSATIKATFYKTDGSILGTAVGVVNDVAPGDMKTFSLTSADNVAGYANMKVQLDTLL